MSGRVNHEDRTDYIKLYLVPVSQKMAARFVANVHRHHLPLDMCRWYIGVADEQGILHGVACIGNTTTQYIDDGFTVELRRMATDGTPNACSMLYAAAWKTVKNMGYRKMITYTLPEEGGSSLRALGWKQVSMVGGNSWAHRSERGYDIAPTTEKTRWEVFDNNPPLFVEVKEPSYKRLRQKLAAAGSVSKSEQLGVTKFLQDSLFDEISS